MNGTEKMVTQLVDTLNSGLEMGMTSSIGLDLAMLMLIWHFSVQVEMDLCIVFGSKKMDDSRLFI